MATNLEVPYLNNSLLKVEAERFLRENDAWDKVPVPIEQIVEFRYHMNIIPTPGLRAVVGCDSFLSNNFSCIYVEDEAFRGVNVNRKGTHRDNGKGTHL